MQDFFMLDIPVFIPAYDRKKRYGWSRHYDELWNLLKETTGGYCMYCYDSVWINGQKRGQIEHGIEKMNSIGRLTDCIPNLGLACSNCNENIKEKGSLKKKGKGCDKNMNDNRKKLDIYANIDMKKSGQKMKQMIISAGYDVKAIQHYLRLSCPQPVYRWFHGKVLPTVDHLFMLSKLLDVHMEDFLVEKVDEKQFMFIYQNCDDRNRMLNAKIEMYNRMLLYNKYIKRIFLDDRSGLSY